VVRVERDLGTLTRPRAVSASPWPLARRRS